MPELKRTVTKKKGKKKKKASEISEKQFLTELDCRRIKQVYVT